MTVQHRYVYPYCAPLDRSGDEETRRRERERRTRQRLGIETHRFLCAVSVQREPSSWDGVLRQGWIPNVWLVVGTNKATRTGSLTVMMDADT